MAEDATGANGEFTVTCIALLLFLRW